MEKPCIGFIGLGIMGRPMAGHLLEAGYSLVVLDKNPLEDIRALRNPQMVFKQGDLMFSSGNLHQDGTILA